MKETQITNSQHAFNHLRHIIAQEAEEVWVLALNNQKKVLRAGRIFKGSVDQCTFHPRDIFRFVVLMNATGFIMAHNHPSGLRGPSRSDIIITKQMKKAAKIMQIEFVDHIIITTLGYFSFQDEGFF